MHYNNTTFSMNVGEGSRQMSTAAHVQIIESLISSGITDPRTILSMTLKNLRGRGNPSDINEAIRVELKRSQLSKRSVLGQSNTKANS